MGQVLHGCARTTQAVRLAIQAQDPEGSHPIPIPLPNLDRKARTVQGQTRVITPWDLTPSVEAREDPAMSVMTALVPGVTGGIGAAAAGVVLQHGWE
jgi:hypothetical protein